MKNRTRPERERENNLTMFYLSEPFKEWLNQDPSRQKNLPHWEELFNHFGDRPITEDFTATDIELIANWEKDYGNFLAYCEVFWEWDDQEARQNNYGMSSYEQNYRHKLKVLVNSFAEGWQALHQLKKEQVSLTTKLNESETNLTTTRQQLDQIKSELSKKQQIQQELADKLTTEQTKSTDLEQQLTALAVSSGLLSQQIENLTNQLTESEQKAEKNRLQKEIQSNLFREQGDKINQQTTQLKNYQQLLKKAEENLTNCQKIITTKTKQLTKLEQEKQNIQTELDQAQTKIKSLENSLLTSQTKIQQLEAQIKTLKNKPGNSSQLEQLKKELAEEKKKNQTEKNKSQTEINHLKQELNQAKLKEEQLSQKIQELSKKPVKLQESQETKSFWQTIKTPLLYLGGGIIILFALGWIISKVKEE